MFKYLLIFLFIFTLNAEASSLMDGVDDRIEIADTADLTLPDADWCIGVLMRSTDSSGTAWQYVYSSLNTSNNGSVNIYLREASNSNPNVWNFLLRDDDGTYYQINGSTVIGGDGKYYWLILQRDTTANELQLWFCEVDDSYNTAVKEISTADTGVDTYDGGAQDNGFQIGTRASNSTARHFGGYVHEFFTATNQCLSQSEIELLANSHVRYIPIQLFGSNLKTYLTLDDLPDGTSGDGDTFVDRSGNGNDGTGSDGRNNTGLTWVGESILSYPPNPNFQ